MSAVIERIQNQAAELRNCHCSMAYFYFNDQSAKQTHRDLLRALLDQLITQEAALSLEFLEEFSSIDSSQLSTDRLQRYAQTALASYHTSYLIVDGVDECSKSEAKKSIRWLLSLTKSRPDGLDASVKILVSGQRDGILDVLLESEPDISLEASSHSADIRQYCEENSREIQVKFGTSDALRDLIVSRVSGEAQGTEVVFSSQPSGTDEQYTLGMFLYAKIVMHNLLHQPTLRNLKREVMSDDFPHDVNKA